MLRTNGKKAIENIHDYIMRNTDFSDYREKDEQPITFEETAKAIYETFHDEKYKWACHLMGLQDAFIDWLQGLPTVIDSCYYYNRSAVKDLGDILEETEAERSRYTEAEAEKMLSYLIFREVYKWAFKNR